MIKRKKQSKSTSKPNKKNSGNDADKSVAVKDRRFWANPEQPEKPDKKSASRKLKVVEKLETTIQEKESELLKFGAALRSQREEQKKVVERLERSQEGELLNLKCNLFGPLLDIADNLERCLQAVTDKAAQEGMQMIHSQFINTLESQGVTRLQTKGEPFNPDHSEAIAIAATTNPEEDNIVLEELSTGYMIQERLIRPARVRVGQLQKDGEEHADANR